MARIIGRLKQFDEAVEFVIDRIHLGKKHFVVSTEYGRIFIEVSSTKPTIGHKPYVTTWDNVPANKNMIPYIKDKGIDFYARVRVYRSDILMENEIVQVLADVAIRKLCGSPDYSNYVDMIAYKWLCYSHDMDYDYARSMKCEWQREFFSSWVDQLFHYGRVEDTLDFIESSLDEKSYQVRKRIEKLTNPYRCDVRSDMTTGEFSGFETVLFIIAVTYHGLKRIPEDWAKRLAAASNKAECMLEIINEKDKAKEEKENKEKVNEEQ